MPRSPIVRPIHLAFGNLEPLVQPQQDALTTHGTPFKNCVSVNRRFAWRRTASRRNSFAQIAKTTRIPPITGFRFLRKALIDGLIRCKRMELSAMLKIELRELYAFSKRNWSEIAVISLSVLFLMLARYHPLRIAWQNHLFYYFLLPVLSIVIIFRRNPLDFGLRLGHPKLWGFHLLIALPVIFGIVYLGTSTADVQRYYHANQFNPMAYIIDIGVRLFAWEFIFRGFMLFGLKDRMKETAIPIQMMPFALLHLGKPESETISCIVSGIYFGYVCYRGNSFWPAFLIHLFINYSVKFLVVYHF